MSSALTEFLRLLCQNEKQTHMSQMSTAQFTFKDTFCATRYFHQTGGILELYHTALITILQYGLGLKFEKFKSSAEV